MENDNYSFELGTTTTAEYMGNTREREEDFYDSRIKHLENKRS